ncbi:hypothetical protein OCU04_006443 [Sclerotinia nivalis]|uniref:Uncharacterized protein n=1 Tax=Sclerotinia nivalis TaxID=352851 RepID=A0A9X0DK09_9HELO|nr:hypothetical protein OCU04_006443 [Sclerotinia nivalis]
MAERKKMAAFQKPKQPRRALLPNISQLTSHESMNGIPMILDTLVLNAGNDTADWQHLYLKSRLLNTKLRSEHRRERDRLIKEKLAMRRAIKDLRVTLSQSQRNNSKLLAAEWSFSRKEIDRLKQQVSGLQSDNLNYSSRVEDLTSSLEKVSLQLSEETKANTQAQKYHEEMSAKTEDLHKKWIELDGKLTSFWREKQKLRDALLKSYDEIYGLNHVLEVYSVVVESIMNRKREWSKPRQQRDRNIIIRGHEIAHGGTCLADAYQIMSTSNNDLGWYEEHYGTTPEIVLKFETSEAFLELINMRYEIYRYKKHVKTAADGFEEDFQKLLEMILVQQKSITAESVQRLLVGDHPTTSRRIYSKLCVLWESGMKQGLQAIRKQ